MSYYFSKVQLSSQPQDRELLRSLSCHGDAYLDHALIWRLFPGNGMERDFLFRRQKEGRGPLSYYVVSRRLPQPVSGMLTVQSKPYQPELAIGDWLRFDVRANPAIARSSEAGPSRRHDVLMDAKRLVEQSETGSEPGGSNRASRVKEAMDAAALQWLISRAPAWGLSIREESLLTSGYTQHRLQNQGRQIAFSSLDYHGLAQVTDPERLVKTLTTGVGSARGFGCGLLMVKRVN
jgi:CRISPR system Cascade subunit CasE